MSIFKAYLQDLGNSAEAILGELVAQKQKIIVKHSVNEFEEQEGTVEQPANYWSCLFNSLKRNVRYVSVILYVKAVNVFFFLFLFLQIVYYR